MKDLQIIGIGLSKTGTKSLTSALIRLGYTAVHFPLQPLNAIGKFDAITDTSILPFAFDLARYQYPNCKLIYTTRNDISWLTSMEKHFTRIRCATVGTSVWPTIQVVRKLIYGTDKYEPEKLLLAKTKWDELVFNNYQQLFGDRLLITSIVHNDSIGNWYNLCSFLDKPLISGPFPHLTKTPSKPKSS